ncbi:ClpP/crotonase-like domain-containing protein [Zychaea mexicana]|uniref:ClpP/crotonase-like domain-containing protein n=1 Tax=Zychaea mexicana TaxID=64656 RepID=UPI0022FF3E86|nr:ClpP/crotonase-like domain-containing protein [Zychaea mexicana]KAI9491730.1 ClpP/crotonase-like domain-containing protein [Zychaea mexicana]
MPQTHVLHRKVLGARMFILNRPEKLNALTLTMVRNMTPQLKAWDVSKLAKFILVEGVGDGRFCAGDDILDILLKVRSKDPDSLHFFQEKFRLAQMISTLQTPYITLLDGYALGGAIGLFAHGPFRIATERTIFATPEAGIGLCPSSGASFFLSKLDGEIGTYLALTGSRVEGVDTFYTGIATHYVPSVRLGALEDRLIDLETSDHEIIHRVIEEFVEPLSADKIGMPQSMRQTIDRCFRYNSIDEILAALDREKSTAWIRETRQKLLSTSPTSLKVTLKALRKARHSMTLCESLKMEFDLVQKFMVTRDFDQGVDSSFLSKPRRKPQWDPLHISDHEIDQLYFSRPSPNDLTFLSNLDMRQYPYARYALPSENEVRLSITGEGSEFQPQEGNTNSGRLKTKAEVMDWFVKGSRGKRGVREKIQDILDRKTVLAEDGSTLIWKEDDDRYHHPHY